MPGIDSFDLVTEILQLKPQTKISMLTMHEESYYAKRYFEIGVMGYITKNSSIDEIEKGILQVLNGKTYVNPAMSDIFLNDALNDNAGNPFDHLTPRELEVLKHLIHGESGPEICNLLHIKPSTLGTLKGRIFEKLHCSNIIDLNEISRVNHVY